MRMAITGRWKTLAQVFLTVVVLATGCSKRQDDPAAGPRAAGESPAPPGSIELRFTYGSEKKSWINDVTFAFNGDTTQSVNGHRVHVTAVPMGSGECIDEVTSGAGQPDLISPASAAFIKLGNAESRLKTGDDLVASTDNLVLSPVVIAMWKPMADALGYGKKPLGWSDVLDLTRSPDGWTGRGHPEWGPFQLGHTHPQFSNSGLISALAMVYAANGKVANLTTADVKSPATADYVHQIESAVRHYGSSTGFFADKLRTGGPAYLSAAVLYESSVIEANQSPTDLAFPLVAIYPKEGTFWSDHPVGIVNRPWVDSDKKAAAKKYIDYLLARPQQEKALKYGFRPADPAVAVGSPIEPANGVDPAEPKTTLEVPSADVMAAVLDTWQANKKAANIVLVLDTSGSMNEEGKMPNARAGAQQLLERLDDRDLLSLLPFSEQMRWSGQEMPLSTARQKAIGTVNGLIAQGGTRLYDSIDAAVTHLKQHPTPDRISAVVVLTDGQDTDSQLSLDALLSRIRGNSERAGVRVFTIGYGSGADAAVLKNIADGTQGKFYQGTTQNIRDVFRDIATFF